MTASAPSLIAYIEQGQQFNNSLESAEIKPTYLKHSKLTSLVMSIAWQGPDVMDSHIYPKTKKIMNLWINTTHKSNELAEFISNTQTYITRQQQDSLTLHSLPRRDRRYGTNFLHSLPVLPLAPGTQVSCFKILINS